MLDKYCARSDQLREIGLELISVVIFILSRQLILDSSSQVVEYFLYMLLPMTGGAKFNFLKRILHGPRNSTS